MSLLCAGYFIIDVTIYYFLSVLIIAPKKNQHNLKVMECLFQTLIRRQMFIFDLYLHFMPNVCLL